MTTTASATSWLARHIGNGHRLYALDATHVRCKDCQQTGVLGHTSPDPTDPRSTIHLPSSTEPPARSRREIPNVNDPDACHAHPGYWADNCGPCRSEVIAHDPHTTPPAAPATQHANPLDNPEWQAIRNRFRGKK